MKTKLTISIGVCIFFIILALWYFDLGHENVENLNTFVGMSETEVIATLGLPDHRSFYHSKDSNAVFALPIRSNFVPVDSSDSNVTIRTLQWDYSRHHKLLWLKKTDGNWTVEDGLRWKTYMKF